MCVSAGSDGEEIQNRETSRRLRKMRGALLLREYEVHLRKHPHRNLTYLHYAEKKSW
jgi:hypothetical protein